MRSALLADVLRSRDLRRVHVGWLLAVTAEWMYLVNLLVFAYAIGGVAAVGAVSVARTIPAALLAPFLAGVADRWPRSRVLLGVHGSRGMVVAGAAIVVALNGPLPVLLALVLVEGACATLHRPTTLSVFPAIARSPEELVASNVTMTFGEGLGVLAGPAIGGLLVSLSGPAAGMGVAAASFSLAALTVVRLHVARGREVAATTGPSRVASALAGFSALHDYPHAGLLVGLVATQTFVRGLLTVLLVVAAIELLLLGESGVGLLNAAIGAGGLIGAAIGLTYLLRLGLSGPLIVGLAFWGLPIALLGLLPDPALAVFFLLIVGAANAVLDASAFTLLQRNVPNRLRARVFGALEGLIALTVGLGSLVAPILVALVGIQMALIVSGALLPLVAIAARRAVHRAEDAAVVPHRQLALLRGVPMFVPLSLTVIEQIAADLVRIAVKAGTDVVRQGEPGDCYFLIEDGRVEVIHDGAAIAALGPGEGFGEIALLRDVARTATVRAATDLDLFRLERPAFLEAISGSPGSGQAADVLVGERLRGQGHG